MKLNKKSAVRFIALVMTVCMCFSLVSCANKAEPETTTDAAVLGEIGESVQEAIGELEDAVGALKDALTDPSSDVIPTVALTNVKASVSTLQTAVSKSDKNSVITTQLMSVLSALKKSLQSLEKGIKSCNTSELKSLVKSLQSSVNSLKKTVDSINKETSKISQLQKSIDELKASIKDLKSKDDSAEVKAMIKELQSSVSDLQKSVKAIEGKESVDNSAEIKNLQDTVNTLLTSVKAIENKDNTSEIVSSINGLQASVDALAGKDTTAQLQNLQASVNALQASVDAIIENTTVKPVASSLLAHDYGEECYEKIQYIDKLCSDRDCLAGANYKFAQKWIKWNLIQAGYTEGEIIEQDFQMPARYVLASNVKTALAAVKSYTTDGKKYAKNGRNYVEAEDGEYLKVVPTVSNIVVVKEGKSDNQIIIGAHYDGDGTGDNGSGIALALTTAQHVHDIEVPNTLVFVFFSAEEYGCYGSTAYANSMTDEEVAKTLYMVNLDSLVCGDFPHLYGGVADKANKTVNKTEAYDNAMKVAASLGLSFKSNPWTYENPEPTARNGVPSYPAPATGDWSDHKGFKNRGIPYVYFEATNWEIPDYSGYGETYLVGMLMNTSNDYLEYIETYFPGRILSHITQFSALLNALVLQEDYGK